MADSRSKSQLELVNQLKREGLLSKDGFAFNKNERDKIINKLKTEPNGLYEKKRSGKKSGLTSSEKITIQDILSNENHPSLHPVVKSDSGYYAILGNLDEGTYGKIKYAQNIETGEIRILKMQSTHRLVEGQFKASYAHQKRRNENVKDNIEKAEKIMRAYTQFEHTVNQALGQGHDALIIRERANKMDFNVKNTKQTDELYIKNNELPPDVQMITLMDYLPGISLEEVIHGVPRHKISKDAFYKIILGIIDNILKVRKAGFNNADIAPSNFKWDEATETIYQFDFGAARPKRKPDDVEETFWNNTLRYAPPTSEYADDSNDVVINPNSLDEFIVPTDETESYALAKIISELYNRVPKDQISISDKESIFNIRQLLSEERHADRMKLETAREKFLNLQQAKPSKAINTNINVNTEVSHSDIKQELTKQGLLPENGLIYTEEEANKIINGLSSQPIGYYEKKRRGKKSGQESKAKVTVQDILGEAHPRLRAIMKLEIKSEDRYFAILEKIGEGAYAKVKYAQDIKTGEIFAIKLQSTHDQTHKILKEQGASPQQRMRIIGQRRKEQENILNRVSVFEHEVYTKLGRGVGQLITRPRMEKEEFKVDKTSDEIDTQYIMLVNHIDGISLEEMIKQKRSLTKEDFYKIALGAVSEVERVHEAGYYNADISPGNFKWNPTTNEIKQIDFGSARPITKPNYINEKEWPSIQLAPGTEGFIDPEAGLAGWFPPNEKTEIYALGKIFNELINLTDCDENEKSTIKKLIQGMTAKQAERLSLDQVKFKLESPSPTSIIKEDKLKRDRLEREKSKEKRLEGKAQLFETLVSNLKTTYEQLEGKPIRFLTPTHLGDIQGLKVELEDARKRFIDNAHYLNYAAQILTLRIEALSYFKKNSLSPYKDLIEMINKKPKSHHYCRMMLYLLKAITDKDDKLFLQLQALPEPKAGPYKKLLDFVPPTTSTKPKLK